MMYVKNPATTTTQTVAKAERERQDSARTTGIFTSPSLRTARSLVAGERAHMGLAQVSECSAGLGYSSALSHLAETPTLHILAGAS